MQFHYHSQAKNNQIILVVFNENTHHTFQKPASKLRIMQSSESPLKLSMERIDLLASVKGLPLVSPKSNVLAYPNHTTRNRAYSATKLHKHVLNTGYSTP